MNKFKLFKRLPSIRMIPQLIRTSRISDRLFKKPKYESDLSREMLQVVYRIEPGVGAEESERIARFHFDKQEQYPSITLPESIYMYLCEKHNVAYIYQADFLYGRGYLGGAVIDFILPETNVAIWVNGLYWHGKPEIEERDIIHMQLVIGEKVEGVQIDHAVRVSDRRLLSLERDDVFLLSVSGVEMYP